MREFEYTFAEGLGKGLRRDSKNPRNNEWCVEAFNVRCGSIGLEAYEPLSDMNVLIDIGDSNTYVGEGYMEDDYVE